MSCQPVNGMRPVRGLGPAIKAPPHPPPSLDMAEEAKLEALRQKHAGGLYKGEGRWKGAQDDGAASTGRLRVVYSSKRETWRWRSRSLECNMLEATAAAYRPMGARERSSRAAEPSPSRERSL